MAVPMVDITRSGHALLQHILVPLSIPFSVSVYEHIGLPVTFVALAEEAVPRPESSVDTTHFVAQPARERASGERLERMVAHHLPRRLGTCICGTRAILVIEAVATGGAQLAHCLLLSLG